MRRKVETGFPAMRRARLHAQSTPKTKHWIAMKKTTLTIPELALVAGTRGMLGAGIALLISRRLSESQRETAGIVLTAIGALTTIPLLFEIMGKTETLPEPDRTASKDRQNMPEMEPVRPESTVVTY
jgi:hypothetical protein